MTSPDPVRERRNERLWLAALLVAVAAVWLPSVRCGFTSWDDPAFCVLNPDVEDPNLARLFDPHHWVVSDWTPLAILSYVPERQIFGPEPWAPHATNVLLHVVAVYLVHRLLRDLGLPVWQSLCVAAVYGIHPLQAESVVWVSGRKNLLMALFTLAVLRAYLAGHHVRATVWFGLGLASKATGVGLPIVAAAAQWMGLGAPRRRTTWIWIAGWLVMSLLRGLISMEAQVEPVAKTAALGLAGRMALMGSVLTTQIRQVFAPYDLSVVYPTPSRAWSDPVLLGQWALIAAVVAACALVARRDRRIGWIAVFALLMMAPTLNVMPGPCLQADRYLQLPLAGIGLLLTCALEPLSRFGRFLPAVVVTAWLSAVCVPWSIDRIRVWSSDDTLWEDALAKAPDSSAAWNYTGRNRAAKGDLKGAIEAFRRALAIRPDLDFAEMDLAVALVGDGQDAEAEAIVRRLVASPDVGGEAHGLLAFILARTGRMAEAGREFEEARRLAPQSERVREWFNAVVSWSTRPPR